MLEVKDPAIKLFGKTIPLLENNFLSDSIDKSDDIQATSDEKETCQENNEASGDKAGANTEDPASPNDLKECKEEPQNSNHEINKATPNPKDSKPLSTEEDQTEIEGGGSQEKTLKKPDKVLPCPRCNSLDTKFCYYNNYNVNQPRHFCKNCQRYWTAGGTMRNVPVGAGRRKNKHSASHYRHIMMSENLAKPLIEPQETNHHKVISCGVPPHTRPLKTGGTVLKFGPDAPLCESMETVLNLGEQAVPKREKVSENGEELSCGSSTVTAPTSVERELQENMVEKGGLVGCCKGGVGAPHLQCFPGGASPWPYPWAPNWTGVAAMAATSPGGRCSSEVVYGGPEHGGGSSGPVQWTTHPAIVAPPPPFCGPTVPFPFVPGSYWGCVPTWAGGTWPIPWVNSSYGNGLSPSSTSSGNNSSTLGKHSRDAPSQGEEKPEKSLWVPKTLRIDDPDEAAKSSIWATLGIKHDSLEPIRKGGIFKAFQPKVEGKDRSSETVQVLQANPAALSRSHTFQESST
ncbi:hypothetical protein AMTRI_Chr01g126580 [Amborella trichopoda]